MVLEWKTFKIDLMSFYSFLSANIPNSDGILATEENMNIIEKNPLTEEEISLIYSYYNSLNENEEYLKVNRVQILKEKITLIKENLLINNLKISNVIEGKILLNLPLSREEEDTIISGI